MNRKMNGAWGISGFVLLFYGMLFPALSTEWSGFIFEKIEISMQGEDSGQLLVVTFSYIARNAITFTMIYFGIMLLTKYMTNTARDLLFQSVFLVQAVIAIYTLNILYSEYYAYLPHLLTVVCILLFNRQLHAERYHSLLFFILLLLTIGAMQWLNLTPSLSRYGFGQNDFAVSLKAVDEYLTGQSLLNSMSIIFFLAFIFIALIFTMLIRLFSNQLETQRLFHEQGIELQKTKDDLIESKVYQEMHTLVHDLKTPLVSVEGLISLMEMKADASDTKTMNYYERIHQSISKMKDMIADMLSEDVRNEIEIEELMDYVLSHLSMDEQSIEFELITEDPVPTIQVNKIRMARAISNIIENSLIYLHETGGKITVTVRATEAHVSIEVIDDGPGIDKEDLLHIWKEGFSTKNSSGIGLPFVKRVIENHQGTINVASIPGSHTKTTITLPHQQGKEAVS
ncbi:sensor histidine kinase [Thalassobacillus hwangdonensis]|uniref:histidine kinase n=1 Tax=Thalassobacillus hwangdonensis TaxID=546108 RepID=A0ABW3L6L6_9BACI